LRFLLVAILVAGCLFALGHYPSMRYDDAEKGPVGLAFGIGLALVLMSSGYFLNRWSINKAQKTFLISFGAGILARLILGAVLVVLYWKLVRAKDYSFILGLMAGYFALMAVEIAFLWRAMTKQAPEDPGSAE
jgi:hypothetical protein